MKKKLKSGDTLIIHSIDRLGRNYEQIIDEWRWFETHNIDIIVLDMPILSTHCEGLDMRFLSNLVLQVLSYVAQKEREQIKKRQREGIDIAMAKGVKFGRPKKDYNIEIIKEYLRYRQNADYYIELSGVSRATFYRLCKEYESNVSIQEQ